MFFQLTSVIEQLERKQRNMLLAGVEVSVMDPSLGGRSWERDLDGAEGRHPVDPDGAGVDVVKARDRLDSDGSRGGDLPIVVVGVAEDVERLPERPGVLGSDEAGDIADRADRIHS